MLTRLSLGRLLKSQLWAEYIDNFATPYQAAKRGMVDIVIQPKDSRPTIINALQMLDSKRESRPAKKHGNIPL